jgi:flagellin-like hook-associated protein FlgL
MRVADRTTIRNYLKYLNNAQTKIAESTQRLASGNRFERVSDDVSAGSRVMRARMEKYKVVKQLDNVREANDELREAENAMVSINDVLTTAHAQKILKALNDPTAESGRLALAEEIKAMKDEILQFANSQYSKKYLFGGTNAVSPPFTVSPSDGRILYNGIDADLIQKDTNGYFYMSAGVRKEIPMDREVYFDIGLGMRVTGPKDGPAVEPDSGFLISYSGLDILGFGRDYQRKFGELASPLDCLTLPDGANYEAGDKIDVTLGGTTPPYTISASVTAGGTTTTYELDLDGLSTLGNTLTLTDTGGSGKTLTLGVNDATAFLDLLPSVSTLFGGTGTSATGTDANDSSTAYNQYSGLSNNLYNILLEAENNIREFDREKLEAVEQKLSGLMDGFRRNLTNIGAKTNFLDTMADRLELTADGYTEKIFKLMGTKDAEEATTQMMNDYVLKAVLQLGSNLLPLSLMDFLS